MRISGGEFCGRVLRTPKGEATRPTSGIVRESLFNILAPKLAEAHFLDLYAGCGSVGLEALSRGAAQATLVEKARPALLCLSGNIAALGVTAQAQILPIPVERAIEQLRRAGAHFDLIFFDPPFADVDAYLTVLRMVAADVLLASDGQIIAQHDARTSLPDAIDGLARIRLRVIGDNALSFYRIDHA